MSENSNKGNFNNPPLEPVPPQREDGGGMEYNFRAIEKKWQQKWMDDEIYKVPNNSDKPKCYVLDMFPYPSGAGLHVGHPLGYIASDIYARYKRLKGFNVLHPMGYDAFGLPAEQYAIEHGVHPADSTSKNIATFRSQLDKIGFSYDWSREVNTSNPKYYKWTQWIFLQLFKSWYNRKTNKTEHINGLIKIFEEEGNFNHPIPGPPTQQGGSGQLTTLLGQQFFFDAATWKSFDEKTQQAILMEYRVAYCGYGEVNWCEALGTVLANDEVVNGVSERGGYPVEKKRLRQWYLRITEYADRLLQGLQTVDFSDAMKEMQNNWIGKSSGAEIEFRVNRLIPQPLLLAEKGGEDSEILEGLDDSKKESGHYFKTADKTTWKTSKEFGKENRKHPTEAEDLLWQQLRNNQLGVKVRRQHSIRGYIVDFAILETNLVIEVDGGYHDETEQQSIDKARQIYLGQLDYSMLRFTNEEVINHIGDVIEKIKTHIHQKKQKQKSSATAPLLREEKGLGDEAVLREEKVPKLREGDEAVLREEKVPKLWEGDEAVLRVYTTRPDTIFGVDFLALAPEHELVSQITAPEQKTVVEDYIAYVKSRSERERMAEKKISGVFTGAHAINPFNGVQIPVWISEYVLAGYGTGAIMAVPSGDERDHKFARHFNLPITNIIGDAYNGEEANPTKDAVLSNSGFLNGMVMRDAIEAVISKLEELGVGKRKVNYKIRDAAFSRQRYWGEPFPIVWKDGIAYPLDESELPLELPYVESYKPGPEGEGPLANIPEWADASLSFGEGRGEVLRETNTMPGYAGSSWYFLRYMDPHNDETFCNKTISSYWNQVDLYVGGTEHAVGHLLYSRMWTKALYDLGLITFDEPFKRLLNQGMIQGSSRFLYFVSILYDPIENINTPKVYVSKKWADNYSDTSVQDIINEAFEIGLKKLNPNFSGGFKFRMNKKPTEIDITRRVNVNVVEGIELNIEDLRNESHHYYDAIFLCEDGFISLPDEKIPEGSKYICGVEIEKMSKSKFNSVSPYIPPVVDKDGNKIKEADGIVEQYGADTFRMYEMFLGPVEMSKPWDTKGIEGVHRFLKKLWRLFFDNSTPLSARREAGGEAASPEELKVLHRTIKKIEEDTERFSYNTAVSAFMVCVNELTDLKCHKKEILEPLLILLAPYAPHIAEELYHQLRNSQPHPASPPSPTEKESGNESNFGEGREGASILDATYPKLNPQYLVETTKEYPVSINGKMRTTLVLDLSATENQVQEIVMQNAVVQKWIEGKEVKKFIFVKNKMVNVVV